MEGILIDREGKQQGVLLSLKEYRKLMARLEELEDALELREAKTKGGIFEDLEVVIQRLKTEGKL